VYQLPSAKADGNPAKANGNPAKANSNPAKADGNPLFQLKRTTPLF